MKKLLDCFDYLKRFYSDILDVLSVMLELFILKKEDSNFVLRFLESKTSQQILNAKLQEMINGDLFVPINSNANVLKILKIVHANSLEIVDIERFLHTISQKRTTNKLFYFSTPKQINDLLVLLLDIKSNEKIYNPCYGMGSIFLSLSAINKNIYLFGEELDDRLSNIAHLIARLSDMKHVDLRINNILKQAIYKKNNALQKFDKVICNPPLYAHMGAELLKNDERFSKIDMMAKNYPELVFLTHSLWHLKKRGVFIVRNQTLQKGSLEERLRLRLVKEKMIEAIIELPKNIFPHQGSDFSILVISPNNESIVYINANDGHFFAKDGKYNKLINIHEIVDIFIHKKKSFCSKIVPNNNINISDLRASYYVNDVKIQDGFKLSAFDVEIFRGQRVYGGAKDSPIQYYNVGIVDFAPCGFSSCFENKKENGDAKKIHKYKLKPYDILLSLRGIEPKITILSQNLSDFIAVANAGIIVIRAKSAHFAINLYCYLFSKAGFETLRQIYEKSDQNIANINALLDLRVPQEYEKYGKNMQELEKLKKDFEILHTRLEKLR